MIDFEQAVLVEPRRPALTAIVPNKGPRYAGGAEGEIRKRLVRKTDSRQEDSFKLIPLR